MNDIKELAKWLEEEVEFLKNNQDYVGGWYDLGAGLGAVVLWEEGWGDEIRDDAIQATDNPDWALCAGIMLINKDDTPDGWFMPWDSKTGDIICETTGITPNEDYEKLAGWLLDDFNAVKDLEIKPNGEVIGFGDDEKEPEAPVEPVETEVEEESCKKEDKKSLKESYYYDTVEEWLEYNDHADQTDVRIYKDGRQIYYGNALSIPNKIRRMKLEDEYKLNVELVVEGSENESCNKDKKKMLKEDKEYSTSPYKDVIAEYFDYSSSFEFLDVVASIIGRIDNFSDDEDIYQAIDDELIYTYDQWKVLEEYCTPQDANWEVAFESLCNDIFSICASIADAHKDADDEMLNDVEDED